MRFLGVVLAVSVSVTAIAQVGGGAAGSYDGGRSRSETAELAKRRIDKDDVPPQGTAYFEAAVLLNVPADLYVAMFGVTEEGTTPSEALGKVDATLGRFQQALKALGVSDRDIAIDFVEQNRLYAFEMNGNVATEKLQGFANKKTISIRYRDKGMIDRLLTAAAGAQIYDLIKVDYVVQNLAAVQSRLTQEAGKIIKRKAASQERTLGLHFQGPPQAIAERHSAYYPTEQYSNYVAAEGEDVSVGYDRQGIVQRARKTRTMYFNPLSPKLFDQILNPVVLEPVVQFTVYMKVRYNTAPPPAKPASRPTRKG